MDLGTKDVLQTVLGKLVFSDVKLRTSGTT